MRLTQLNVHPVKSTAVRPLASADVLARGLVDDRSWMVVDGDGVMVSARELPALYTVVADTPSTAADVSGALRLSAPGLPELTLDVAGRERVAVRLFGDVLHGLTTGPEADAWLRRALGRPDLRLVWCDDPGRRRLKPDRASPANHTAFADAFPVSLVSEASLRQLDAWILGAAQERGESPGQPLSTRRFRPNLVVDGDEPFAEDRWAAVEIGGVRLRVAGATGRCVMTTIDPGSLARGAEPLRTLAKHRRRDGKARFALDLVPETTGTLTVGDEVVVTARRDAAGP